MDEFSSRNQRLIIGLGSLGTALVAGACEQLSRLAGPNPFLCLGLDSDRAVVDSLALDVYPLGLENPPHGLRDVGRALFMRELPRVADWLSGHLRSLPEGKLSVTLVGSLAGGTGSAVLCDFAYLLRRLAGPIELEALIPHSARPPRTELGGANAYAALTELNHWMAPDTAYRLDEFQTSDPPVDRVGLLSCRDLGDSLDREGLPAQLTAYLALSLWPAARPLWEEARRELAAIEGQVDEDGNPLAYFSPSAVAMPVPGERTRSALLVSLLGKVVSRWKEQAGAQDAGVDEAALSTHAQEFLTKQGLVPRQVMIKLGHAAGGTQGFMKSPQVSSLFDDLERKPPQGQALAQKVRELETAIIQSIGPAGPDGMLGHSRHHARQVRDHCLANLKEDLKAAAGTAGYGVYVHQLRNVLVDRMESLQREVEKAEAEEQRLEQDKDALLREITQPEEAGLVGRLFGRKKDHSGEVPTLLKLIEEFYTNRLKLEFHRIGTTVFAEVLKEVEQVYSKSYKVNHFLQQLGELSDLMRARAVAELAQEAHMAPEAVLSLLEARLGKAEVERAARALTGEPSELPSQKPAAEAAAGMLAQLEEQMGSALELDLIACLGAERRSVLEQRALPVLQPRTHLGGYHARELVRLAAGSSALAGFRAVPGAGKEGLALLGMRVGFPLRAVELSPLHQSYLHELRQSKVRAHNRDDTPWRAIERVSPARREELWLTLAQAMQLGHLAPGDPLESKRWPEMGPVKRCLARFARPEEALYEETHFLIALSYWREEKLEELGVEEFLQLLEPQELERELLGENVEPWLERARQRLLTTRDQSWPDWERLVRDSLASSPVVCEADLVEIPAGYRRWVLSRYAESDPELTFDAREGTLEKAGARATRNES